MVGTFANKRNADIIRVLGFIDVQGSGKKGITRPLRDHTDIDAHRGGNR